MERPTTDPSVTVTIRSRQEYVALAGQAAGASGLINSAGADELGFVELVFDTELTSLTLTGGPFLMPLASDPGNAIGDSIDGYGFVNSEVTLTLSSQRLVSPGPASLGEAHAYFEGLYPLFNGTGPDPEPIDPEKFDDPLWVFFNCIQLQHTIFFAKIRNTFVV